MQEARGKSNFDGDKINGAGHSKWKTSILQREVSCQAALGLQYLARKPKGCSRQIQILSQELLFSNPCSIHSASVKKPTL